MDETLTPKQAIIFFTVFVILLVPAVQVIRYFYTPSSNLDEFVLAFFCAISTGSCAWKVSSFFSRRAAGKKPEGEV